MSIAVSHICFYEENENCVFKKKDESPDRAGNEVGRGLNLVLTKMKIDTNYKGRFAYRGHGHT